MTAETCMSCATVGRMPICDLGDPRAMGMAEASEERSKRLIVSGGAVEKGESS